jgi:alkanesulfonate monooxygenase SsuD/methylene tetrahydromethanopterin reductase-like flavin-dependent oxidoreductase (luciferase family)
MQYVANLMRADIDASVWAKDCEDAGWDGVALTDHTVHSDRLWPHVWVAASAAAVATEQIFITTAFANNLIRHPVEFAQAAMGMQVVSHGRFEAGLGAGWAEAELAAIGIDLPPPGERVERYIEAVQICRQLFDTGACSFQGTWYHVEIESFGIDGFRPPPLLGALGGSRMLREAGPHLDRIEVKAAGSATRGGALDFTKLGLVSFDHVRRKVDQARQANPDAPLSFFALCSAAAGSEAMVADFPENSIYRPFFGEPQRVVDAIEGLADLGFDRATVSPVDPAHFEAIATLRPG